MPILPLPLALGIFLARFLPWAGAVGWGVMLLGLLGAAGALLRHCRWAFWALLMVFLVGVGMVRAVAGDVPLLAGELQLWFGGWGDAVAARLAALGLSPDTQAVAEAMLLGRRAGLSPELSALYRTAGAAHLLALSGLHAGLLFGFGAVLVYRLGDHPWLRWLVCLATCLLMLPYAAATGFPASLVRALLMLAVFLVGITRQSGWQRGHTLSLTAFVMLLLCPSYLWDVGFQLSFVAVAGIVFFYPRLQRLFDERSWAVHFFLYPCLLSLAAQLGSTPLVVYYFHSFSPYSLLLSPFHILFTTVFLYLCVAALLLGAWFAPVVDGWCVLHHGLLLFSASLPGAVQEGIRLAPVQLLLLYVSLGLLFVMLGTLRRRESMPRHYRLVSFLRSWPLLLALLLCLAAAFALSL